MKRQVLLFAAFIFGMTIGCLFAEEPTNQIVDPNINSEQEILGARKLDLRPGDILPRLDNQYVLGNQYYRWAGIFASSLTVTNLYGVSSLSLDSLTVSTITASSGTITNLSTTQLIASSITLTNLNSLFKVFVGTFTSSAGTGNQSITGIGFRPRLVKFDVAAGDTSFFRIGFGAMDAAGNQYAWGATSEDANSGGRATISRVYCVALTNSAATDILLGSFVSMDADGFTINWVTASPFIIGFIAEQ